MDTEYLRVTIEVKCAMCLRKIPRILQDFAAKHLGVFILRPEGNNHALPNVYTSCPRQSFNSLLFDTRQAMHNPRNNQILQRRRHAWRWRSQQILLLSLSSRLSPRITSAVFRRRSMKRYWKSVSGTLEDSQWKLTIRYTIRWWLWTISQQNDWLAFWSFSSGRGRTTLIGSASSWYIEGFTPAYLFLRSQSDSRKYLDSNWLHPKTKCIQAKGFHLGNMQIWGRANII